MIYKIMNNSSLPKEQGFVFRFSFDNLVFIEKKPKPVKGQYEFYVPTTEEQRKLATDFDGWLASATRVYEQQGAEGETYITYTPPVGDINQYLNPEDIQAYKDVLWNDYEELMETFDLTGLNKLMHFTSSLGFRCNGDRRTLENIRGLHDILQDDVTTVPYRDYDNQSHELTKPQLATLMLELQQNGLNLYTQKWTKQAEIEAAKSLEQLRDIDFTVEWLDFTPVQEDSGASIQNDAELAKTIASLFSN